MMYTVYWVALYDLRTITAKALCQGILLGFKKTRRSGPRYINTLWLSDPFGLDDFGQH